MGEGRTTIEVQNYLDVLANLGSDAPPDPVIRALIARAVDRLHMLCSSLLHRSYPRLTRGPLNLESEELLGGVVERLIKALSAVRPATVRQFFALANQHMRWELNDLARRLDDKVSTVELHESLVGDREKSAAAPGPNLGRVLKAIEDLPDDEREVFNLVRIQGMTHPEAAEVVGVSPKTVQRRLARGTIRLEDSLGDLLRSS